MGTREEVAQTLPTARRRAADQALEPDVGRQRTRRTWSLPPDREVRGETAAVEAASDLERVLAALPGPVEAHEEESTFVARPAFDHRPNLGQVPESGEVAAVWHDVDARRVDAVVANRRSGRPVRCEDCRGGAFQDGPVHRVTAGKGSPSDSFVRRVIADQRGE